MKKLTIYIPDHYKIMLDALAKHEGRKLSDFVRRKLIEAINHHNAMRAMVRQAIVYGEIRDEKLEKAGLEAINSHGT